MNTTPNKTRRRLRRLTAIAAIGIAIGVQLAAASPASAGGKSMFPSYGSESSGSFGASTPSGSDHPKANG